MEPQDFCLQRPDLGHCRSTNNRWFYDTGTQDCAIFPYSGCEGNENNFESREKCLATCRIENIEPLPALSVENLRLESAIYKVDCKVSDWIVRPCNVTCGEGIQIKTRKVLRYPRNGGRLCPKRMIRIEKCFMDCPDYMPMYTQAPRHYHIPSKQQRAPNYELEAEDDCEYSNWSPWSP